MTSGNPADTAPLVDQLCARWEARAAAPDRGDAERALAELYEARGWGRPTAVVWLDSPLAGAIAARTLLYGHENIDRARHPEAYETWVAAATARLEGAYGAGAGPKPSSFEEKEPFAPRWRLPQVDSAYRLSYDLDDPDVRAVLHRVGEPAWAINTAVAARFKEEALSPGDPELFAEVGARAHDRLAEGLRAAFPAERWEAVRAAVRACAEAPRPDGWKRWRRVWEAVRAPDHPALLILAAVRGGGVPATGELQARLRMAPAVGWWWALNGVVVASPPPAEVSTDELGRLHREDGPAVRYADGFAQHCWRGRLVPPDLVDPGWGAADIVRASDEELRGRAAQRFGAASYAARLSAEDIAPDLRRCAVERLGWARFAAEAPLARVAGPVPDPGDPGCELTLHDVPAPVLGRAARVVVHSGGAADGAVVLVPADAADPVAAAGWLGHGRREPAPPPELLTRIWESEDLQHELAGLDCAMPHEHVEAVHLYCGAPLYAFAGHSTGGTYFLCGDGPRRPVLYADSEGGCQVLGRDLEEALRFMVSAAPDGDGPEDADADAAAAFGLTPLTPGEYRARKREAAAMAGALTLVMADENNAYEYRPDTWFR
ncbi:DUF6745 domain-containing protein [Actinomadura algeriensis]|uniref:DUF6745 domain-containing protein n=1 Tax=Actinomadura algeriensis TaxID=1679523 RepID=A0ABR9JWC0_9ACTN|nr:hypothetical protein [Actinomadura algeriensis]MBE1534863.1 hypothetical protein [Actinomadura algeriensis]